MILNETTSYSAVTLPPSETTIWRYVSLAKLLAMLQTRSVFFSKADLFDDGFEGTFTQGSLSDYATTSGNELPDDLITLARWLPCRSFVSCWHVSDVESAAFWKMYAGSEGAIAIRSSIGALSTAFPELSKLQDNLLIMQEIRRVRYIDYRTAHPHINDLTGPLTYKRQAFAFEQEIRVIRQELPTVQAASRPNGRAIQLGPAPTKTGLEIAIILDKLVDSIYLAPSSPPWMLQTVKETMGRFGLGKIDCRQSSLDELPEFGRLDT